MITEKVTATLTIDLRTLDHILDIDLLKENRDVPPSELFKKGLQNELGLNGYKGPEITEVIIKLK